VDDVFKAVDLVDLAVKDHPQAAFLRVFERPSDVRTTSAPTILRHGYVVS
jgi:hypothetical protein